MSLCITQENMVPRPLRQHTDGHTNVPAFQSTILFNGRGNTNNFGSIGSHIGAGIIDYKVTADENESNTDQQKAYQNDGCRRHEVFKIDTVNGRHTSVLF